MAVQVASMLDDDQQRISPNGSSIGLEKKMRRVALVEWKENRSWPESRCGPAGERLSCRRRNVLEAGGYRIGESVCRLADEADLLSQEVIRRVEDLSPFRKCRSGIFVTSVLACRQGSPLQR